MICMQGNTCCRSHYTTSEREYVRMLSASSTSTSSSGGQALENKSELHRYLQRCVVDALGGASDGAEVNDFDIVGHTVWSLR